MSALLALLSQAAAGIPMPVVMVAAAVAFLTRSARLLGWLIYLSVAAVGYAVVSGEVSAITDGLTHQLPF